MRIAASFALLVTLTSGCADETGTVMGPEGGVIRSDDGMLSLELRAGSLEDEVALAIEDSDECPEAERSFGCYAFSPWGVPLMAPATVVFHYEDAPMDDVHPTELVLLVEGKDGWKSGHDHALDMSDDDVWATVTALTTISVVGESD